MKHSERIDFYSCMKGKLAIPKKNCNNKDALMSFKLMPEGITWGNLIVAHAREGMTARDLMNIVVDNYVLIPKLGFQSDGGLSPEGESYWNYIFHMLNGFPAPMPDDKFKQVENLVFENFKEGLSGKENDIKKSFAVPAAFQA